MALSDQDIEFLNNAPFGTAYRWAPNQQGVVRPRNQVPAILSADVGDYACYDWALKSCQSKEDVLDPRAMCRGYLQDPFGFREPSGLGANLCIDDALAAWGGAALEKERVKELAREVVALIAQVASAARLGHVETYLIGRVLQLNGFDVVAEGARNHTGYKVAWHSNALEASAHPYFPSIEHAWLEYGRTTIQKTSGSRIEIGRGQNYGRIGTYGTTRMHRLALRSFTAVQEGVIHELIAHRAQFDARGGDSVAFGGAQVLDNSAANVALCEPIAASHDEYTRLLNAL